MRQIFELGKGITVKQMIAGAISFFISVFGIAFVYPFTSTLFDMWTSSFAKATAIFIMWLMFFFVSFFITVMLFTSPKPFEKKQTINMEMFRR